MEIFFSRILARLADAIIVHCQTAKQMIGDIYEVGNINKIVVIPHGNYIDVYDNSLSRDQAKSCLNISSEDFVFLFLGNIRHYKGVFELIESFKRINDNKNKLIIAGRLEDEELSNIININIKGIDNIHLTPNFISKDEIQMYMNASDVMVLPYRDILTSGAAILAMSFEKAIIAPKIGCLPDILDNSGSFLYDPTEKDGLLNALKKSIESRGSIGEMGHHNMKLAVKLSWQDIASKTLKVYKRCLNRCHD